MLAIFERIFSNKHHPDPNDPDDGEMFHFEKVMF